MSALATFRRAMRRYEKRARAMGLRPLAIVLRWERLDPRHDADHYRGLARLHRGLPLSDIRRRAAFLYERAADAVARLREATS